MTYLDAEPLEEVAPDFAARLKAETKVAHDAAEHVTFMDDLLAGRLERNAYVALLEQYSHLYRIFETQEARFADSPILDGVLSPQLHRLESIEADLRVLLDGRPVTPATAGTLEYMDRIEAIPDDAPERFFAHHYLRYLGDLSGGQIIGRLAARHYDIPATALNTWNFSGIDKLKRYKDKYRAAMDASPMSLEQQDAFIDEAKIGFALGSRLFESTELLVREQSDQ